MDIQWVVPLLSGFVASTLTFIYSSIRERKQLKINNRAYISFDEIRAGDKLENLNIKPNTRLIVTENYRKIEENIKNGVINKPTLNYLKIKNIGPGLILDCNIKIKLIFDKLDIGDRFIDTNVSMVEKDEEIYIVTDDYAAVYNYIIGRLEISYRTQTGEQMKFLREVKKVDDVTNHIKDTYFIKTFFKFKKIYRSTGSNEEWIIIN